MYFITILYYNVLHKVAVSHHLILQLVTQMLYNIYVDFNL